MLKRKLTALACAAGILAFGACYGGAPSPPPPPPPPGIDMKRLHSIRIVAANPSESHHLSSGEVSRAVAIAWRTDHTGIGIHLKGAPAKKGEALLEITVLSEHASLLPPDTAAGKRNLAVVVSVSATLTRQNGTVIWQQSGTEFSTTCASASTEASSAWNDSDFKTCVVKPIASQLVNQLVDSLEKSVD